MSRFHGAQGRGAMRRHRELLRVEAEERQAVVRLERTCIYRLTGNPPRASMPFRVEQGGRRGGEHE